MALLTTPEDVLAAVILDNTLRFASWTEFMESVPALVTTSRATLKLSNHRRSVFDITLSYPVGFYDTKRKSMSYGTYHRVYIREDKPLHAMFTSLCK